MSDSWKLLIHLGQHSEQNKVKKLKIFFFYFYDINHLSSSSVHEGEAVLVLPGLLGGQLLLEADFILLLVVVLQGRLNEHPAGHHGGDALPEGVDLEVVDRPVEAVDLLGAEFLYQPGQVITNVVLEDVVLELGRFLDVVVHLEENIKDEVEGLLVDVLDGDCGALLDGLCLLDVLHGGHLLLVKVVLLSVDDDCNHLYH